MKNLTKLVSSAALVAALSTSAFAGSPAPVPVEPDVFVENDTGLGPWAIAGIAAGTALLIAAIADDDDDEDTTTQD
ncbi:hypothetical protein R5H30_09520 [Sulfitobacter sp. D35]|uniref:hypothetical protein n=1 Tax=Sulfitobacter sp. D35 TaxID=3083252 RepID=UPI00296F4030|nr:hypothetical protein [Sulfitobacter sp. D35]MDW4498217.1 hypothetical protein [Sulfitobacter sp. D35]